ncbi:MAG TPA: hypothetical protein VGI17_14845 [Solirubrobacterales bacterium]
MRGRGPSGDLGPVQVLVIGIDARGSDRMLAAELQDLRTQEAVKVLDVLRVRRGYDDEVRRLDPLDTDDRAGALVEALLVVDPNGDEPAGERSAEEPNGEEEWFLADRVPRGAAAAILLIEHRWAIPLREAASQFAAEILGDAWVHPRDLAAAMRVVAGGAP